MPRSQVRLSAGRSDMSDEMQAMCFFAGANSIFYGEKLLTAANPEANKDSQLFERLGIHPLQLDASQSDEETTAALLTAVTFEQESKLYYDAAGGDSAAETIA